MKERNCGTCRENDDGFCDRKGILVDDDDTCEKWGGEQEWKEKMMNTFLAGH